ncbi:MAG: dihydrodipicolinate synthase family protein [Paracoccaceae bacterium]
MPETPARSAGKMTEIIIAPFGISTALLTPFHSDGRINHALFSQHAKHLLENGPDGVTLFGTTGEGASIGFDERQSAIQRMIDSGIAPAQMTLGLCASAIADVNLQVQQGIASGITEFLLLPPFYFKGLDDEGLYDWHARLFKVADPSARFILYHIPQITEVPLSFDLIMRLRSGFPKRVMALKDSAGEWKDTRAVLESKHIPVLVGDERLLHRAAAMGGAGSICGMANLYPNRLRLLFDTQTEDTDLSANVDLIVSHPVIPALKQAMVAMTGNPDWGHLRAPLRPLGPQAKAEIDARFSQAQAVA